MNLIDLHMHSTFSDGTDGPEELARTVKKAGLSAMALTDHDTTSGNEACMLAAKANDINFIPGCEISTKSEYGSHHILGLWTPENNRELELLLAKTKQARTERNKLMLEKLRNLGIDISEKDFPNVEIDHLGRPHIANYLLQKGIVANRLEAFDKYLGKNGLAFAPKHSPTPEEAISLLAKSGATPIWAHPCLDKFDPAECEMLVRRFAKAGLAGIEAYHSKHSPEATEMLLKLAHKYDLAISGGSDYHGKNKPEIFPGIGENNLSLPESILQNLISRRKSQGLPC